MKNYTTINTKLFSINNVELHKYSGLNLIDRKPENVIIEIGIVTIETENKDIEIKVGDNKVKATMFEFMQAFKDMLDTEVFEMDQIDSEVWDIENKLEVLRKQYDYLNETLAEIRGGF
jgi:ASC-1-like (ASCH) protein